MTIRLSTLYTIGLLGGLVAGCDDGAGPDDIDPTDVQFGDTAIIVVVNPTIDDANDEELPPPGLARAGLELATDDGVRASTDASGIAVLAGLTPGIRAIDIVGDGVDGTFTVDIAEGELRELALAADGARAEIMVDLDYRSDRVTEISPTMSNAEVNSALAVSDTLVFFGGGVYEGDIDFSGSRVTLFGEGVLGGAVLIDGDVIVSGSDSRIRGTEITGTLTVPASGIGVTFSLVHGATASEGSDATFLQNALCSQVAITGSGSIVLGNVAPAPTVVCSP